MSHYILNKVPNHLIEGYHERRLSADIPNVAQEEEELFFDSTEDRPIVAKRSNKTKVVS